MVLVSGCRAQRSQQQSLSESTTSAANEFQEHVVTRSRGKAAEWFKKKKKKTLV